MEISPAKVFYMIMTSVMLGAAVGALNDFNRVIRMLLGYSYGEHRFDKVFKVRLPLSRRPVGAPRDAVIKPLRNVVVFFQDVFLLLTAGVGVSLLNYYFNNGRARLYTPAAVLVGFLFYYFTVGKLVVYFSDIIVFFTKVIVLSFLELLYFPLSFLTGIFYGFVKKIYTNLYKALEKKRKMVYNNIKKRVVMSKSGYGFVDIKKNSLGGSQ